MTIVYYKTPGNFTFTTPPFVTRVQVTLVGGGGGGGGCCIWSDVNDNGAGAGWGGNATTQTGPTWVDTIPGQQFTVVVGAGGGEGPGSWCEDASTAGTAGGDSRFYGTGVDLLGPGAAICDYPGHNPYCGCLGSPDCTIIRNQNGESTSIILDGGYDAQDGVGSPPGPHGDGYGAGGGGASRNCTMNYFHGGKGCTGIVKLEYSPAPTAAFTTSPSPATGAYTLHVDFTDTSTDVPTAWDWNFGDNTAHVYTQNCHHDYPYPGTYSATLICSNAIGWSSISHTVTVNYVTPTASFTAVPTTGDFPLTVAFTDTSADYPTSWLWYFDDGGIGSSLQSPTHIFRMGTSPFHVTLTATNPHGSNTSGATTITITTNPTADFVVNPSGFLQRAPFNTSGSKIRLYDRSVCYASRKKYVEWLVWRDYSVLPGINNLYIGAAHENTGSPASASHVISPVVDLTGLVLASSWLVIQLMCDNWTNIASGQIELGSGGAADIEELSWDLTAITDTASPSLYKTYAFPLTSRDGWTVTSTGGAFVPAAIDWVRVHATPTAGNITIGWKNARIVCALEAPIVSNKPYPIILLPFYTGTGVTYWDVSLTVVDTAGLESPPKTVHSCISQRADEP